MSKACALRPAPARRWEHRAKDIPMIPYDPDPSLHAAEPQPPQLDDGFSPPPADPPDQDASAQEVEPALWAKSAF